MSHETTRAAYDSGAPRGFAAFQQLTAAFVELDMGDARFLAALSRLIFGLESGITITISHYWALVHLEPAEGRTMAALADLLLCDRSNVTRIVDKLEVSGWARRVHGKAGDRRFTSVVLTETGRNLREMVVRAHDHWVSERFAVVSSAHLAQLSSLLDELRVGLRADPEEAAIAAFSRSPALISLTDAQPALEQVGTRAVAEQPQPALIPHPPREPGP